jgi:hypothetical protein
MSISEKASRRCYFSIIGSPRHVAEALYICSLPKMAPSVDKLDFRDGSEAVMGASAFPQRAVTPRYLPLFSFASIDPPPAIGGRQRFTALRWGAANKVRGMTYALDQSTFTLATGKITRLVSAHMGGQYHPSSDGYPKDALITLSKRCPNVVVTCFSHDDENVLDAPRGAGFFRGKVLGDLAIDQDAYERLNLPTSSEQNTNLRYLVIDSPDSDTFAEAAKQLAFYWTTQAFSPPEYSLQEKARSALGARWSPALMSCNDGGPNALSQLVRSLSAQRTYPESVQRFFAGFRTTSGFGVVDATLAGPIRKFAKRQIPGNFLLWPPSGDGSEPAYENHVCHIQSERIEHLAALCADDSGLAALIGSEAGRLAGGMHVIALMARVAKPRTAADVGVKNILSLATFRMPDPAHAVVPSPDDQYEVWYGRDADIGPLNTLCNLAASGNVNAWEFLLEKNESGEIRGFDKRFLAASVILSDDLPRWLEAYGSKEIRALADAIKRPLSVQAIEMLTQHELAEGLRAPLLSSMLPTAPSSPQPKQPRMTP